MTPMDRREEGAEADSLRRSAGEGWRLHGAKEGARGGTTGSPTLEPVDAPDAPSFPDPDHSLDGERGYEPIRPRSGLGDLLQTACRADRRLRLPALEVRRPAAEAEGRHDGSVDARLDRGLRLDLGAAVRDRVRHPHLRPRARARPRAQTPGGACERTPLHPVPGRDDRDEGAPRRRLEGGARRSRRADPRLGRRRGLLGRGGVDGLASSFSRSRSPASS